VPGVEAVTGFTGSCRQGRYVRQDGATLFPGASARMATCVWNAIPVFGIVVTGKRQASRHMSRSQECQRRTHECDAKVRRRSACATYYLTKGRPGKNKLNASAYSTRRRGDFETSRSLTRVRKFNPRATAGVSPRRRRNQSLGNALSVLPPPFRASALRSSVTTRLYLHDD
jgi:hypothetical protein